MKKALLSMFTAVIIFLFLLIFFTLYNYSVRYAEVHNALELSMQQAIAQLQFDEGFPVSEEVWLNDFANSVALQIQSHSELSIEIYEADMEKGILSAEAILTYRNPTGGNAKVRTGKRTILLNQWIKTGDISRNLFAFQQQICYSNAKL